jgi:alpha-ribazole phosphatase
MSERLVHLLRHGPPRRTGLLLGHTDEPAMTGDCPIIRDRTAGLAIRHVVTSDLCRARDQAAICARDRDVALTIDPAWRELDFGAWDGMAPGSVDPSALASFWDDPDAAPPPGGERWSTLRQRVSQALDRLDTATLVVTHGGAMRAALSVLTGLDHRAVWALDLPYRALLTLRIWPGSPIAGHVTGLDTGPVTDDRA